MGKINIELLKSATNELRTIKDGKGSLSLSERLEVAKVLGQIHRLVLKLEAKEKDKT